MSGGWNHTVRALTDEELAAWQRHEDHCNNEEGPFGRSWLERYPGRQFWQECSGPKCHDRPAFRASYSYVTGRRGRVSHAEKDYCVEHAQRFAKKHGLELPEVTRS